MDAKTFKRAFEILLPNFLVALSLLYSIVIELSCDKYSKITADGDCSHEIKRRLLLGGKVMTNLDSILKSRDISLSTKVCLVKAMVFPVVMYGCELDYKES